MLGVLQVAVSFSCGTYRKGDSTGKGKKRVRME